MSSKVKAAVLLVALVACKKTAPRVEVPPPTHDASAIVDAATTAKLPADFPGVGGPPLSGKLVDKRFEVAKAVVRTQQAGTSLDLYGWLDGGPCEPQFAPEPDQLYVSVRFPTPRFVAGAPIASSDERVIVTYKKPDFAPVDEASWTVFDEITADRAKGRIQMSAPDGTRVAGSFDATVCASPQRPLGEPSPIHGMSWGTRGVDPSAIPKQPVSGVLLGKPGTPVAIEVVDWKDHAEQHEVHFFFTPPNKPCDFDQLTPGFKVGAPSSFKAGQTVKTEISLAHRTGTPFAAVLWAEPGNVVGMEGTGWLSLKIDRADKQVVEGRVFAWFNDASKSMIVGAFTAKNCNITP